MNRRGAPLGHVGEPLADPRHRGQCIGAEMLGGRLRLQLDAVDEEKAAVLRHLLQGLGALALREDHTLEQALIGALQPQAAQLRAQMRHEGCGLRAHHVLLIQPQQLLRVEGRCRLVDIMDVERGDHLRAREHLLVAVRPAQAHEIIKECIRQVALLLVLQHAHRAVALRELGAIGSQDHGHVRIER